jgi:hypothetical protein
MGWGVTTGLIGGGWAATAFAAVGLTETALGADGVFGIDFLVLAVLLVVTIGFSAFATWEGMGLGVGGGDTSQQSEPVKYQILPPTSSHGAQSQLVLFRPITARLPANSSTSCSGQSQHAFQPTTGRPISTPIGANTPA